QIFDLASAGHYVDAGSRTVLSPESKPLLGRPDFRGIVYTTADPLTRALVGEDGILAVVTTGQEIEIADQVGHSRLLSRRGQHERFFPTPPWTDRSRAAVLVEDDRLKSVLDQVPRVSAYRATAWILLSGGTRAIPGPMPMPDFEGQLDSLRVDVEVD